MPPKRANDGASASENPSKKTKAGKQPKTLKEKILDLVSKQTQLVGLATIKKILYEQYDVENSTASNNRILKAIKELCDENRNDFGKAGGSYHAGPNSAPCQAYEAEQNAAEAKRQLVALHRHDIQCPYCEHWNDTMKADIGEDSIARGSKYRCLKCSKICYSWISDRPDELVGHKVEYRYGNHWSAGV